MRPTLLFVVVLSACSNPFAPDEFWCHQTHYFTIPDSVWALPDSVPWNIRPDSVVTVMSENGECP